MYETFQIEVKVFTFLRRKNIRKLASGLLLYNCQLFIQIVKLHQRGNKWHAHFDCKELANASKLSILL